MGSNWNVAAMNLPFTTVTVGGRYWPGFQVVFQRLLPRLGYQSDVWAVAHRLCRLVWKILHEGMRFIEQGHEADSQAKKKRAQIARALRRLGYEVTITPIRLCNFCSNGDILWWSSMEK